jgi:hypothetical protein
MTQHLREKGWLAGFRPDSSSLIAKLPLPGAKPVHLGLAGAGATAELLDTEDSSGRKKGLGERLGRAGLGATTGLISAGYSGGGGLPGMAGGFAGELAGEALGREAGGRLGRGADVALAKLRGKPKIEASKV